MAMASWVHPRWETPWFADSVSSTSPSFPSVEGRSVQICLIPSSPSWQSPKSRDCSLGCIWRAGIKHSRPSSPRDVPCKLQMQNIMIETYEKLPAIYISQPQYEYFCVDSKRIFSRKEKGGGVVGVIKLTCSWCWFMENFSGSWKRLNFAEEENFGGAWKGNP